MGKAIRRGQGEVSKVKLDQAVKLQSSLQHVMTVVPLLSTSARQSRSRLLTGALPSSTCPASVYSCSPSGSCSQKHPAEGRCLFTFVPIKKIKWNKKIVMILVWQNPHSSWFLKPCDFHLSAGSQQWVRSLQPRVKSKPGNSCLSQLLFGFSWGALQAGAAIS